MTPEPLVPCWQINPRWPKFCASLSNGHGRCRKGTCFIVDAYRPNLFDQETPVE